jgi:hypothetical protein
MQTYTQQYGMRIPHLHLHVQNQSQLGISPPSPEIGKSSQGYLHCQFLICKGHLLTKNKSYISKKQARWLLPSNLYSFFRELNLEYM